MLRKKVLMLVSMVMLLSLFLCGTGQIAFSGEEYPARSITVIATFKAGGGVDRYTRGLTTTANKYLGQHIVVKNVAGAGGATGALEVFRAKPDGYTLMSIDSSLTTLEIFQDLPFSYKDFEPIAMAMRCPTWFLCNSARPYKSIQDLIDAAKKNPGKISVGVAGPSGSQFLMARAFESALDLDLNIIPFSGGADLMAKLVGNLIDAGVIHSPMGLDFVQKGDMRILVAGGPVDVVVYDKTIPTFEEIGIPMEFSVYRGIFAPPGTPEHIIDILDEAIKKMCEDEHFINFGKTWGVMPKYADSTEFRKILDKDYETFMHVYKEIVQK